MIEKNNALREMKFSLEILNAILTSRASHDEKVAIFADVVKAQSDEIKIGWKILLEQYRELSAEVYNNKDFDKFIKQDGAYIRKFS